MNKQDKELAAECGLVEDEPLYLPMVLNFANRYHAAKLEQDPEVLALREEVERFRKDNRVHVNKNADLVVRLAKKDGQLLTAQAKAKKLREALLCAKAITDSPIARRRLNLDPEDEGLRLMREALSTPINTTEIDALVKKYEQQEAAIKLAVEALELTCNAVKLAGWEGDYSVTKAEEALAAIKESGVDGE